MRLLPTTGAGFGLSGFRITAPELRLVGLRGVDGSSYTTRILRTSSAPNPAIPRALVAARWAVDQFRESVVRNKYDKGPSDDADGCVRPTLHPEHRDRFDTKRYLAVLKELFDSGQLPEGAAEILWGEADRVQHAEIAAELGIGEVALRSRLFRMRAKFRAKLAALGMLALALLLLTGLLAPSRKVAGPVSTKGREPTPSARSSWQ